MKKPIVEAAWSGSGLFPFNPDKVLNDIQRPTENQPPRINVEEHAALLVNELIQTPATLQQLSLRLYTGIRDGGRK